MGAPSYTAKFEFPTIGTERLLLRMFEERDLDSAFRLFNDNDVQKYLSPENKRTRKRLKVTFEKLRLRWEERGFGIWCVCEKSSRQMIGYCGFQYLDKTRTIEIVFAYLKEHWNKGFATEAANACLGFGFERLEIERIYAVIHPENTASQRVLKKIGMSFDRASEHYQMNLTTYTIAREEYVTDKNFYRLTDAESIASKIMSAASQAGEKLYFTAAFK
jgi:ribosomal-protein-alanine N-acetyltransferase